MRQVLIIMDKIVVRLANLNDSLQIAKIYVGTWQCAYRGQMPDDFLDKLSVEKRKKRWEEILKDPNTKSKTYVAQLGNQVIGFASFGPSRDEDMTKEVGELWGIYIDAGCMNKGVGSALMKEGLNNLRELGYKKATLWVLTFNEKSRSWYEHKGWKVEGKTKTDKEDGFPLNETRYVIDLSVHI